LKEVISKVSHSKKWPRFKGENGWVNSYSLLQDKFFEHMKSAGFEGFERGERGSTAVHLSDLEFKTKKETERLAGTTATVELKEKAVAELGKKIANKEKQLAAIDKKLSLGKKAIDEIESLDSIGKKNLVGQTVLTPDELKSVKNIIRREVKTQEINNEISKRNAQLLQENTRLQTHVESFAGKGMTEQMQYFQARHRAPQRMAETVADIMRQPPEKSAEQNREHNNKNSRGEER
jgi:FtsZ-binding cell division protein ZapB